MTQPAEILAVATAIGRVIARRMVTEQGGSQLPYLARETRIDEMASHMAPDLQDEAKAAIEAVEAFDMPPPKPKALIL